MTVVVATHVFGNDESIAKYGVGKTQNLFNACFVRVARVWSGPKPMEGATDSSIQR
jgi:hypothetical protein